MTRTLTDADVEAIAGRLAELLEAHAGPQTRRWLTAAEVAKLLGRSRAWVYDHAEDLGGVPLPGAGTRPRLQFDREVVEERLAPGFKSRRLVVAENRTTNGHTQRRQPRAKGTTTRLLPIAGIEREPSQ